MTERDSTSEPATSQARRYTVGYRPNGGRPNPSPQLTIKGKWLEQLGFTPGQPVSITAENGCLVIRTEVGR
ncbi:SymE family type I addiction module toxin [Edaphovirga cremea]|uniref:SymE family type I addiction module toxin n=1 Tax=Edaphovirga cremea TaxID=2267246 RepID=UPI003988D34E